MPVRLVSLGSGQPPSLPMVRNAQPTDGGDEGMRRLGCSDAYRHCHSSGLSISVHGLSGADVARSRSASIRAAIWARIASKRSR